MNQRTPHASHTRRLLSWLRSRRPRGTSSAPTPPGAGAGLITPAQRPR